MTQILKKSLLACAVGACIFAGLTPAHSVGVSTSVQAGLTRFENRLNRADFPAATGISVSTLAGQSLANSESEKLLMPASTMKIVTAVVALETLSPDYRFTTRTVWQPSTKTLWLVGGGDPLLSSKNLATLASKVRKALPKIKKITLRADTSMFGPFEKPQGWSSYSVPWTIRKVSPLVVDDAIVADPADHAVGVFAKALKKVGIASLVKNNKPSSGQKLASIQSLPITKALGTILRTSDNNMAEMVFRVAAAESGGQGTWSAARSHSTATLTKLGLNVTGLVIEDGSGMSRNNRLTADFLVKLLNTTRQQNHPRLNVIAAKDLMATAGKSGTLNNRFNTESTRCAVGAIEAKTGTFRDVTALAGFAQNIDGTEMAFAVIINNVPGRSFLSIRSTMDRLATSLVNCEK